MLIIIPVIIIKVTDFNFQKNIFKEFYFYIFSSYFFYIFFRILFYCACLDFFLSKSTLKKIYSIKVFYSAILRSFCKIRNISRGLFWVFLLNKKKPFLFTFFFRFLLSRGELFDNLK